MDIPLTDPFAEARANLDLQSKVGDEPEPKRLFRSASSVEVTPTSWLWHPRIARGKLTILGGDPGQGKGFVTARLASHASRGTNLPDTHPTIEWSAAAGKCVLNSGNLTPCDVLMVSYEDGAADTLVPRLLAAGADLNRIKILDQVADDHGRPRNFLPDDLSDLERALGEIDPCILIIDPIGSYVPGQVDAHRDNEVRSILQPLADFADRTGIAVIGVMHLNKSQLQKVLYRISGSVGFVGIARSVLVVGQEEATGKRGIAHIKSNLAVQAPTLEFEITNINVDGIGAVGCCQFGPVNAAMTAEQLLGGGSESSNGGEPKYKLCAEVIFDYLDKRHEGVQRSTTAEGDMLRLNYSEGTIKKAKKVARVESFMIDGTWWWSIYDKEKTKKVVEARLEDDPDGDAVVISMRPQP